MVQDRITPRQRRFVEAYRALGDARQAAELAGYRGSSAERLMRMPAVRARLERPDAGSDGAVASADEVLQYLTRVLRADAGQSSMKAAELLGKRLGLFSEQGDALPQPVIVDDIRRAPGGGRKRSGPPHRAGDGHARPDEAKPAAPNGDTGPPNCRSSAAPQGETASVARPVRAKFTQGVEATGEPGTDNGSPSPGPENGREEARGPTDAVSQGDASAEGPFG